MAYYSSLPPEQIPSVMAVGPYLKGVHRPGGFEYGLDTLLTGLQTPVRLLPAPRRDEQTEANKLVCLVKFIP